MVVRLYFAFVSKFQLNSGDPDQTPLSAASDLGLHCLPMSHKKDARLIYGFKKVLKKYLLFTLHKLNTI